MRKTLSLGAVLASTVLFLLALGGSASADNCDLRINPEDCQNTAWTVGTVAAVAGAVTAVAVAAGVAGAGTAGGSAGIGAAGGAGVSGGAGASGGASGGGPATAVPPAGPTEQVVVSGPEAVDILVRGGAKTVVRDGTTYLVPPVQVGGPGVVGIGHTTTTLPDGTEVVGPDDVAIVQEIPARDGPQTIVEGPSAVTSMIDQGFPTVTDPATGVVHVRVPPNLIHGNVTGIVYGGTTVVGGVEVIDPNDFVAVVEAGPRGSAAPTPPAGSPTTSTPAPSSGPTAGPGGPTPPQTPTAPPTPTPPPTVPTPPTTPPQTPPDPGGGSPPIAPPGGDLPPPPPPLPPPPPAPPTAATGAPPTAPAPAEQPAAPPTTGPPRVPTDAGGLVSSLTQPGVTVLTPSNASGLVPDLVNPDGTLRVPPTAPSWARPLDGSPLPPIQIENGVVRADLGIAGGEVRLDVRDGRLVASADGTGLASFSDLNRPIQARIDRLNDAIARAGLEVKDITADAGEIRIVTGSP